MSDEKIIDMYFQGYSIDYIAKCYHRYKNRNQKPVILDGIKLFPAKIYNLSNIWFASIKLQKSFIFIPNNLICNIAYATNANIVKINI